MLLEEVELVFQHVMLGFLFLYLTFNILERSFGFVNTFTEHLFCFLYNITLRVPNSALATIFLKELYVNIPLVFLLGFLKKL